MPRVARRISERSAPGKIRTCDLCLRRAALYPLSYGRPEAAPVYRGRDATAGREGCGMVDLPDFSTRRQNGQISFVKKSG